MKKSGLESVLTGWSVGLHDECAEMSVSKAQMYIYTGSGSYKRLLDDDGRWWLPVDTPSVKRTRWPSSQPARRGRTGIWTRSTDPWGAEDNLKEHWIHKDLWKTLRLTSDAENKDEMLRIIVK